MNASTIEILWARQTAAYDVPRPFSGPKVERLDLKPLNVNRTRHRWKPYSIALSALVVFGSFALAAEKADPPFHRSVGQRFVPTDVDRAHPVYQTTFDDASVLKEWRLEGGKRA